MRVLWCYRLALMAVLITLPIGALTEDERAVRDRIASVFGTVPDDEVYGEVLEIVLEVMESRYGVFGYIDEQGAFVCPSMTRDIWEECQIPDKDIVFPRHTWGGIWGRSLIEKKTLYVNDPLSVPDGHIPIQRAMMVPILYGREVIGLFEVANKTTDYTEADQEVLESIADYVAPHLRMRLQRDRAVVHEVQAKEHADTLGRSQKYLAGLAGVALSVAGIIGAALIRLGRTQKTIENHGNDIEAAQNGLDAAKTKQAADVVTLRKESHECRTRIHGRLDSMGKDLTEVKVGVAEIRGAARMWKQNNGLNGPNPKKE